MEEIQSEILIIGGGLTGLSIAHLLRGRNVKFKIIEARNRLGGRIYTSYSDSQASLEQGATWLGTKHTALIKLLDDLHIDTFKQELSERAIYEPISTSPHQIVALPPNTDPSFRIKGGSSVLINTLAKSLSKDDIYNGEIVNSIEEIADGLLVKSSNHLFKAKFVISTLPPKLLESTIAVSPALPESLSAIAKATHTWMGESIKIGLRFKHPFWRKELLSGTIISNVGPIPEMYDHSNFEDSRYALKGFLDGAYYSLSKGERLELIKGQLRKYYGRDIDNLIEYEELIWRSEKFTYSEYNSHVLPHQNNGHSVYRDSYLNGKLFIAGSETANQFPGYMEGAVRSAIYICKQIEDTY